MLIYIPVLLISATCLHVCPCANRTSSTCKNMAKSSTSGEKRGTFKWKSKVLKIFLLINIFTFYTKRIVTNSKCRIGQLHQTTTAHFFGVFQHSNYTPIDQNRKQFSVKKVLINPVFVNRPAPQD